MGVDGAMSINHFIGNYVCLTWAQAAMITSISKCPGNDDCAIFCLITLKKKLALLIAIKR